MRRSALSALFALPLLAAGCGSGGSSTSASLTPAQAVRAAAKTPADTSSRLDLLSTTHAGGQDITFKGTGIFATVKGSPVGEMTMTFAGSTLKERILDGVLYLQPPGQAAYFNLPLKELGATSLADTANPGSAAQLLSAMGDDTTAVGSETIHGAKTTHYKGTIDVAKAKAEATNDFAKKAVQRLLDNGATTIPADVYLDDKGRLRRLIEHITLTIKGVKADSTTQIDLYDFGVKVDVQKPPADQIKDGAPLLAQLKSQGLA